MATIKAFIRTTKKNSSTVNVRFRLTDGRSVQLFHKSDIEVDPSKWDDKKEQYKAKVLIPEEEKIRINNLVSERKKLIREIYSKADREGLTTEKFNDLLDKEIHPEKYKKEENTIFDIFDRFLSKKRISKNRRASYMITKRILQRYELFTAINMEKPFKLTFDYFTPDTLEDLESFIRNEHTLCEEYPEVYKSIPESRKPVERGHNRVIGILSTLRTFILWANDNDFMSNNPFKKYSIGSESYGRPIYITIDERNKIYNTDLSKNPSLAIQRDIFVFQCLIGCRISDLYKLTPDNIMDGFIEYIPKKTKEGRPIPVRVPLNDTAKEIVIRYKDVGKKGRILPFISEVKYNEAIKKIFTRCEINRMVTVINPITREEEKRPINEIASSHMARRTFAGNLYKKHKDPNLVGALTGHKEGSKAFARYRDIDDDIRLEVIKSLD